MVFNLQGNLLEGEVFEHVFKTLQNLGDARNLRLCNQQWKAACDNQIRGLCCDASEVDSAESYMKRLPNLERLLIRGNLANGTRHGISRLRSRDVRLETLILKAGHYNLEVKGDISVPSHAPTSLLCLLLPWSCSLTSLHLSRNVICLFDDYETCGHGFFSQFPLLEELVLGGMLDIPALDLAGCVRLKNVRCGGCGLGSLIVDGCVQLASLICCNNFLQALDVLSCTALTNLDCSHNQCARLDLTNCASLLSLRCSRNNLHQLDFSACKDLKTLICDGNHLPTVDLQACSKITDLDCSSTSLRALLLSSSGLLNRLDCGSGSQLCSISGGFLVSDLCCHAATFALLSSAVCAKIEKLELLGSLTYDMSGFQQLQHLTCSVGPGGSINLEGCSSVHMMVHSNSDTCCFNTKGRSAVQKLSLIGDWNHMDFTGFTSLIEVNITISGPDAQALDLSACQALEKATFWSYHGSRISAINLTGCSAMQELVCNGMSRLKHIDLSACSRLRSVEIIGSGLDVLDVSYAHQLQHLDVSDSDFLIELHISCKARLSVFKRLSCPILSMKSEGELNVVYESLLVALMQACLGSNCCLD